MSSVVKKSAPLPDATNEDDPDEADEAAGFPWKVVLAGATLVAAVALIWSQRRRL